jgi:two-component system nitrate/nitrite response regulator NarL
VVGEASNGEQGIELAESLDPDLILLDLNMPGMNGLETSTSCGKNRFRPHRGL